ncbi:MAG TPA: superoxide dismutase [Geminicoccaceae bacterium]|nr:superoxide dismutase [Geminicoccaceae bacterium]
MHHLSRRGFLAGLTATTAAAAAGAPFPAPRIARGAVPFLQPPLPYPEDALAPTISARTVALHYGRHHAGYFSRLNSLAEGSQFADRTLEEVVTATAGRDEHKPVFDNAAQAWNHVLYWEQMDPRGTREPTGELAEMIGRDFVSLDGFKLAVVEAAAGVFGSGWVWLTVEGGRLVLMPTANADNPLAHGKHALMGIDVWEHAYYLDYENRREEHVRAVLDHLIDFRYVEARLAT